MQKISLLFVLLLTGLVSAQNQSRLLFSASDDFAPVTFSFGFKNFEDLPSITLYSPSAMITSKYISTGAGYLRTNTVPLPMTLNGITVDSFNPNGASNLQTAIRMGIVRTIFKL